MKTQNYFTSTVKDGKRVWIHSESGKEIHAGAEINDFLQKLHNLGKGDELKILLATNDGKHEEVKFSLQLLRDILDKKAKGVVATKDNRRVEIYNASLEDEKFPIVGLNPDNKHQLTYWDPEGNCVSGAPELKLCIQLKKESKENKEPEERAE